MELSKQAAEIHAYLRKTGRPIQDADMLIVATALLNDLTVVADDSEYWLRVPELKVVNGLREWRKRVKILPSKFGATAPIDWTREHNYTVKMKIIFDSILYDK